MSGFTDASVNAFNWANGAHSSVNLKLLRFTDDKRKTVVALGKVVKSLYV